MYYMWNLKINKYKTKLIDVKTDDCQRKVVGLMGEIGESSCFILNKLNE